MDHTTGVAEPEAGGKTLSFPNGTLRKHHLRRPAAAVAEFLYRECLKNHAASLGGHALDGCGEFMLSPAADPADPSSLRCAACGCHRNFHRRLPDPLHHRLRDHDREGEDERNGEGGAEEESEMDGRRDPSRTHRSSNSPPPFYSAPRMLLALGGGPPGGPGPIRVRPIVAPIAAVAAATPMAADVAQPRKRFRTRFTPGQKERMQELSERLGWRMQKREEGQVEDCCRQIGVDKGVFKVWMHNNKHAFLSPARKGGAGGGCGGSGTGNGFDGGDVGRVEESSHSANGDDDSGGGNDHAINGSSSSS